MLKGVYFLVLTLASVEDYKKHRVSPWWTGLVFLLGLCNWIWIKENRWVTLALTCACILLFWLLYQGVRLAAERFGRPWQFGGADVKLIPGMMLVQGWDVALEGIFLGCLLVVLFYLCRGKRKQEIPLVPWMTVGCFVTESVILLQRVI